MVFHFFSVKGIQSFKYGMLDYDNLLHMRGLDLPLLNYHPFREDGKIIWTNFKLFAKQFTDIYYKHDFDVQADEELQVRHFLFRWLCSFSKLKGYCSLVKTFPGVPKNKCLCKRVAKRRLQANHNIIIQVWKTCFLYKKLWSGVSLPVYYDFLNFGFLVTFALNSNNKVRLFLLRTKNGP